MTLKTVPRAHLVTVKICPEVLEKPSPNQLLSKIVHQFGEGPPQSAYNLVKGGSGEPPNSNTGFTLLDKLKTNNHQLPTNLTTSIE